MRSARKPCLAIVVALLALGAGACTPDSPAGEQAGAEGLSPSARPPSAAAGSERISPAPSQSAVPKASEPVISELTQISVTFSAVVDGDTVETSQGTVRLIGIDTPERGECGHDEASMAIGSLVSVGDAVTLDLPDGQNDRDSYGRLLRYVITESGVDLGQMQVEAGNAIARYDSTDGYPAHPRQDDYHAAQIATAGADGSIITTSCGGAAQESIAPLAAPVPTGEPWWEQYGSCSKLKKNTVGHPKGPFSVDDPAEVDIYNWFEYGTGHHGDGDSDGLACE
ncbi:thermonuclease family protein [Tessaracoccus sp. MC1627]|uniref:thermonuclease family protein n=1 Tax=Tessaracoccus sp. MC1627 TaxID=2760312 RepID=UPI001602022B|nr:thermonuclease family protein [Tessaracoccus sp. MC1627]MBB1511214.1 thermonuclease family protein [Tessaracoccus sp. MC1627]